MFAKVVQALEPEKAQELRDLLMASKWVEGQARTPELTGTIKQNLELIPGKDGEHITAMAKVVTKAVTTMPEIAYHVQPAQSTMFKFNMYLDEGTYNRHTDAPYMGPVRTDFACTVFLTDPDEYDGGELNIEQSSGDIFTYKGKQGEAIVYKCGRPHWVNPVTRGERVSAIGWIQSVVRDEAQREILSDVLHLSRAIEKRMDYENPDDEIRSWFVDTGKIHSALHRMWDERINSPPHMTVK